MENAGNNGGRAPARVIGRPFQPGQSGNPSGRPKSPAALIRQRTQDGEELVETLVACMRDESARWRDRVAAVELLAAYVFGRPVQAVEHLGDGQQMRIKLSWQDGPAIELPATMEGEVRVLPPPADEPPA